MQYFVTGATGFIGKRLVKKLLERKGAVVHFLIREESADKVADLRSFWGVGPARAVPVFGDLTAKALDLAGGGAAIFPGGLLQGLAAGGDFFGGEQGRNSQQHGDGQEGMVGAMMVCARNPAAQGGERGWCRVCAGFVPEGWYRSGD